MENKTRNIILRTLMVAVALFMAATALAKDGASISFKENLYDFGQISAKDGKVTHEFTFTNTGDKNLTIINARADCGCTRPEYSDAPVAPGKTGKLKVTYVPTGKGYFSKKVTVTTNGSPRKVRLLIKGEVVQ